jgi:hypothetical protein
MRILLDPTDNENLRPYAIKYSFSLNNETITETAIIYAPDMEEATNQANMYVELMEGDIISITEVKQDD